jgi:Positive regulator of sigma(E), RseC/MucC.
MLKAAFFVYVLPLVAVSAGIYLGLFSFSNFYNQTFVTDDHRWICLGLACNFGY